MIIKVNSLEIGIEKNAGDFVYISHAHKDHLVQTKKPIIASKETIDFIKENKNSKDCKQIEQIEQIDGITLFNSGHLLGSTQIEISNGEKIVYTGDFKLRDGFTTKGAEILECDRLFIDCTYSEPIFSFPEREEIENDVMSWIEKEISLGNRIVLGAYKIGKAQEVIKLLNKNGIVPVVSDEIEKICKIYEKYGIDLKRKKTNGEDFEDFEDFEVGVFELHKIKEFENFSRAVFTGWAMKYKFNVKAFPLSDHADFFEVIYYIKESKAKEVYCINGSRYLSEYVRRIGINSRLLLV
ncbi:MAG: MBL fold metallo-hydrolase [Candidatus Micrarchaeia archaeon]